MMPKKIFSPRIAAVTSSVLLVAAVAIPVFAQTTRPYRPRPSPPPRGRPATTTEEQHTVVGMPQVTPAQMTRMIERSNQEIDQRVTRLNALSSRIQAMKKVSDGDKTSLLGTIQTQITALTDLKTKIAADTDAQALRTDMQSITKAYRIYALVMPQIAIFAAADRVSVISDALSQIAEKLKARIDSAQAAGNDTIALIKLLADMNAKITDARTQTRNATTQIQNLKPDNGDEIIFKANAQTLKDAHAKIKTAMKDLADVRKDAETIRKALRSFIKPTPSASPSASASPTPTPSNS